MDVIKTFMAALDNTNYASEEALNEATRSCSNFGTFQELINQMVSDRNSAGSAENFLVNYCGIILDNEDTGAITGADAGGSTVKTRESIVPESGAVDRTFTDSAFSVDGLTVRIGDPSTISATPQATSFYNLTPQQQYIWQALHSWWIKGALDLNAESYGSNYGFTNQASPSTRELYVFFSDDENVGTNTFAKVTPFYSPTWDSVRTLKLKINMRYAGQIAEGDANGTFTALDGSTVYFDSTLAHEFTHAVMAANINRYSIYEDLPNLVIEGLAELTVGIDQKRYNSIKYLADNPEVLAQYLNNRDPNNFDDSIYSAGYMLFRYLNKQGNGSHARPIYIGTDEPESKSTYNQNNYNYYMLGGNDTVFVHSNNDWVEGGDGDDYIYGASDCSNSSIFGGNGNDSIFNHVNGARIYGDEGNDYISNFSANVTIYGGNGDDSIYNNRNNYCTNVLIDAGSGNDYISNWEGYTTILSGAGDDLIRLNADVNDVFKYNVGDGNDTVETEGNNHLIDLSSVPLDQYANVYIGTSEIGANFASGGSLRVKGSGSIGYKIVGGDVWAYNQSTNQWFTK